MRKKILSYFLVFVLGLFPLWAKAEKYEIKEISLLSISSAITPATLDYLKLHFSRLPDHALPVITMNTPGGLVTTTKDIINLIGKENRPVVVWITPQGASAASAGAIIAASAQFILMSPGTNMGAATPVGLGEDIKESDGRAKIINDLTALIRSLSQSQNRPSEPFELMIKKAESYTDKEALKLGIIDGIISSPKELTSVLENKPFTLQGKVFNLHFSDTYLTRDYEPTWGQSLLEVIANPQAAYFLFLIGVALLYFEMQAPGGYIAGGLGVGFIILAAIAFQVLPLSWGALALIIVGGILLVLEIYITSYGLLGIAGAASFIAGSLFLFHGEEGYISIKYSVLLSTLAGVGTATGIIILFLFKDQNKLKSPQSFFLPEGSIGVVVKELNHADGIFQIKAQGEIWKAQSQDKLVLNDKVKIKSIDEKQLLAIVEKIN